jgi:hypothetical protein
MTQPGGDLLLFGTPGLAIEGSDVDEEGVDLDEFAGRMIGLQPRS